MIALIQRVSRAEVWIAGLREAGIDAGVLALICAEPGDTAHTAERLLTKMLGYRIFQDADRKMNRSVQNLDGAGAHGGLLLVPQFTLAADTHSGSRPSFTGAAPPALAREQFDALLALARQRHSVVASGVFGADMQVSLVNDGPVTFWLQVTP